MSRVPPRHVRLSHQELTDRLAVAARLEFADGLRGVWNPDREEATLDLARGVMDAFALALHVLWTYQEAWAEEGFLATAQLDESADRLLAELGYHLSPGTGAVGLQHFRCRAGMSTVLPRGFRVRSTAQGDQADATFETLEPLRLAPELNEVRAYLPSGSQGDAAPANADVVIVAPPKDGFFPANSLADGLYGAIQDQRLGDAATRAAARARQKALRLADMMSVAQDYADANPNKATDIAALKSALQPVCAMLCELQDAAKPPPKLPGGAFGELTESQEILARALKILQDRKSPAVGDLEAAMKRCADESDSAYGTRLAALARFLDGLVTTLVQDARDQLVLLHGGDALTQLDRAFGGTGGGRYGVAPAGTDRLFLLAPGATPGSTRTLPMVRPGDWFVLAEDVQRTDLTGKATTTRIYRQALRVKAVADVRPAPERSPLTRIEFAPPLARDHDLANVVLLGNVAPISEGSTVDEPAQASADRRAITLPRGPLTWLRDPGAPSGRRPEIELTVGGRPWRGVASLFDPAVSGGGCYCVEPAPGGGVVLRVGDGWEGVTLPEVPLRVRYRTGLGAGGNRAALRIASPASAHPAVEDTFNPLPTSGGSEPEPRALACVRGPRVTSAMDRAVSLADVQALALAFDGVLRARVFREGTARHARLLVVVAGPGGDELSEGDLDALRGHLIARVPPGIAVTIENRLFVPVRARIRLRLRRRTDPMTVVRAARLRLGVDREEGVSPGLLDPDNIDLDADLQLSQLYGALEGVPGLHSLIVEQLYRESALEHLDEGPPNAASSPLGRVAVGSLLLNDRLITSPRELLGWARPTSGDQGVELPFEEVRDL